MATRKDSKQTDPGKNSDDHAGGWLKAEEALIEAQNILIAAQADVKGLREAQVKIQHASTAIENALREVNKAKTTKDESSDPHPKLQMAEAAEQRTSFILRLTIDKGGQPRRTEIEHAQSSKKEIFPSLDFQKLASFIEECIRSSQSKK